MPWGPFKGPRFRRGVSYAIRPVSWRPKGAASSVLAWTPTEAQGPSTNEVVVSVSDGVATVTSTLSVVVREVNASPTLAGATNAAIDELAGYVQALVPRDADVPVQMLTVALVSGPAGLVVTNGVLAWTPTEAQGPSTNAVVVSVSDGVATVTSTFNVVVREVNALPTLAGATNAVIDELAGYVQALVPQDADIPVQTLTVALVSGPAGLVVTNGVLAWTPTEAQGPSTNEVVVSVSDGVATVTSTLRVVVREVNAAPIALPDVIERRAGEVARVMASVLIANDSDAEGDPLVVTSVASRSTMGGTVVMDGGWVVYSPPVPEIASGDDSFSYEVSDGKGGTARGMVTVRLTGPPKPTAGPLRIADLGPGTGRLELRFEAISGRTYRLEGSDHVEGPWSLLASLVGGAGGEVVVEQAAGGTTRFFRVVEP